MNKTENKAFPEKLFCLYQGISDDLLFWALFDVLFLTINKGFTPVQISLVFTVSYWAAIVLQIPSYRLIRKLKAGGSIIFGSFLFLAAAVLITFGNSIIIITAGQCLYRMAALFQSMSSAIVENAVSGERKRKDYVRLMSGANVVISVISFIAACTVNSLFAINPNLPMYICIGFCACSCVLAVLISRYDTEKEAGIKKVLVPGRKTSAVDTVTITCLVLSVVGNVILMISGCNLRIFLEQSLTETFDAERVVLLYSLVMIGTRIFKLSSNLSAYVNARRDDHKNQGTALVVYATAMISVLGTAACLGSGISSVVLVAAGILLRAVVYDPYRVVVSDYMLRRLNHDKMLTVLYWDSYSKILCNALFSSLTTVIIAVSGLQGVMLLLLGLSVVLLLVFVQLGRAVNIKKSVLEFRKWSVEDIDRADDLTTAAAVLIEHYHAVKGKHVTPNRLAGEVTDIRNISGSFPLIRFNRFEPYSEEKLYELYESGHPCAILARQFEDSRPVWLPVIFLDEDGGIVFQRNSDNIFISEFPEVQKICSFSIQN